MNTYVVGHKNPDTDSIISAIIVADILGDGFIPAKQGEPNKETLYVLERFGFDVPVDLPNGNRKVVLVDHNSPDESPDDLKADEIVAIYDHHKLGGPITSHPAEIRIEKVGCTATVVYDMYGEKGIKPPKGIRGITAAAIISDTLNLTSPTTTNRDGHLLAEIAAAKGFKPNKLAGEMFAAKSDISDMTSQELIGKDYKTFDLAKHNVGVGVWETMLPETVFERKSEIINLLKKKKSKDELDYIFFSVIDIFNNSSDLIIVGPEEEKLAEAVFGGKVIENVLKCPGVVSRKTQITPPLEVFLAKNN